MLPVSSDWTTSRSASADIASAAPASTRLRSATKPARSAAWAAISLWKVPRTSSGSGTPARVSTSSAMARSVRPDMEPGCGIGRPNNSPNAVS